MTIPILTATSLQRILQSGRTKPCIFFCEDETGERNGEYVVKLKAGMETGVNGLAAVSRRLNLRSVGSLEGKRKKIIGIIEDAGAFPAPKWWIEMLEEVKDRN